MYVYTYYILYVCNILSISMFKKRKMCFCNLEQEGKVRK